MGAIAHPEPGHPTAENPTTKPDTAESLGRFTSVEAKNRSLANLRPPFRKGQPAPVGAGRPRKDGIFTSTARRFAKKKFPGDAASRTYGELVVESMFKQAIKGNVYAAQLLFERLEGRVALPSESEMPCVINVQLTLNKPRYPEQLLKPRMLEGRANEPED